MRKRKIIKIVNQYPLSADQKRDLNQDLIQDLKTTKEEARKESRNYYEMIDGLVKEKEASQEEAQQWKASLSEGCFYKQRRNIILKNLRKQIEQRFAQISYNENIDYNQCKRTSKQKYSNTIPPIKEILSNFRKRNFELEIDWIQTAENKVIQKGLEFIPLTPEQATEKRTKLEQDIRNYIDCEERFFDKPIPFPFFPVSLRSFSRRYKLPCKSREVLSIIKKLKCANCIYTLKMPNRDKVICLNENEIGEEWEGLEKLAEYIKAEYQKSKNFQNWKKLIAKIKGFTLGEAYMLMKRRIKSGTCSEELFYTKNPNYLLAKKIIKSTKNLM